MLTGTLGKTKFLVGGISKDFASMSNVGELWSATKGYSAPISSALEEDSQLVSHAGVGNATNL